MTLLNVYKVLLIQFNPFINQAVNDMKSCDFLKIYECIASGVQLVVL